VCLETSKTCVPIPEKSLAILKLGLSLFDIPQKILKSWNSIRVRFTASLHSEIHIVGKCSAMAKFKGNPIV
jgi:hypothetical protein